MACVQPLYFTRNYENEFFQDIQEAAKFSKGCYDLCNLSHSSQLTVECTFSNETKITYVFKKIAEDIRETKPDRVSIAPGIKGHLKTEVKKAVDQRVVNYIIIIHFANTGLPIDGTQTSGGIKKDPNLVIPDVKIAVESKIFQRNPLFGSEYFQESISQVAKPIQTSVAAVVKTPVSSLTSIPKFSQALP